MKFDVRSYNKLDDKLYENWKGLKNNENVQLIGLIVIIIELNHSSESFRDLNLTISSIHFMKIFSSKA